ncbi:hypothetical protein NC652_015062 [Populus alba x Populus x berolinensis]|nr:hypothetical protein NC652_015062 [Populus alba x Populus x berolinensis]
MDSQYTIPGPSFGIEFKLRVSIHVLSSHLGILIILRSLLGWACLGDSERDHCVVYIRANTGRSKEASGFVSIYLLYLLCFDQGYLGDDFTRTRGQLGEPVLIPYSRLSMGRRANCNLGFTWGDLRPPSAYMDVRDQLPRYITKCANPQRDLWLEVLCAYQQPVSYGYQTRLDMSTCSKIGKNPNFDYTFPPLYSWLFIYMITNHNHWTSECKKWVVAEDMCPLLNLCGIWTGIRFTQPVFYNPYSTGHQYIQIYGVPGTVKRRHVSLLGKLSPKMFLVHGYTSMPGYTVPGQSDCVQFGGPSGQCNNNFRLCQQFKHHIIQVNTSAHNLVIMYLGKCRRHYSSKQRSSTINSLLFLLLHLKYNAKVAVLTKPLGGGADQGEVATDGPLEYDTQSQDKMRDSALQHKG